jgi:CheY-like chemotaxis protein
MLSVADTGIGMDAATKERIFEPFFTTKEKGKGTGLGLAMVFDIVAQNGGQIRVHSEPGRGATFRVYFPCVADTRVPSVLPLTSSMLPPRGSERILLVEDEGQVRTVMRNILQRAGYEVIESPDPEDALLANERSTGPIDMLLTDLVMPKMSGRALAEHFLRRRPAAKVLYVSGYGEDMIESHGMLDPGVAFLQKPITPGVLLRRTRDVLDS